MLERNRTSAVNFPAPRFVRHAPDRHFSLAFRRAVLRWHKALYRLTRSPSKIGPASSLPRFPNTNHKQKQTMQRKFANLTYGAFCAVLALSAMPTASAEDKAPSATGNWTWTVPGRNGGTERKMTLTLTQDGEKLTGKLSSPGRDGGAARETEITDGSVKGTDVTFSVTREFNERKMTSKYSGKLTADAITGKVESKDRDGNDQSRDWTAKKEAK
jgi:hypothetical protein